MRIFCKIKEWELKHSLPLLMNSYPDFDHKVNFFPNQTVCIDTKQSEKHSSHENYLSSKE